MSFGKDPNHVNNIPGYGGNMVQKARQAGRRGSSSGGGGGGMPFWKDNFSPPEVMPTVVRVLYGEYKQPIEVRGELVEMTLPFHKCREHGGKPRGKFRSAMCSAGPLFADRKRRGECRGCELFWEDVTARNAAKAKGQNPGPRRMNATEKFVYSIWDYAPYFKLPDTDNNGQYRMNPKTNQPYYSWVTGDPNDPKFAGCEWKQGHLLPWPCGRTYQDVLLDRAKQIGNSCATCGTVNGIRTVMKICGNPQCGQPIYDPNNTTLTMAQRQEIDEKEVMCSACGQENFANEIIECAVCASTGRTPLRAQLWDVDIQLQAVRSSDRRLLQILNHSEPRPIQVQDPEVLKTIKPLDLQKKFAPTPLEKQYELFGAPDNTAAPPPNTQQVAPPTGYAQPPQAPQPQQYYPPQGQPQFQQAPQQAPQYQQPMNPGQMPAVPYPGGGTGNSQ